LLEEMQFEVVAIRHFQYETDLSSRAFVDVAVVGDSQALRR
jgi:hypothetical protein